MPARPQCEIVADIEKLSSEPLDALKKSWVKLHNASPPADARREYLVRGISYKIQEKQFGTHSASVLRALRKPGIKTSPASHRPRLKSGSRLIREWQGAAHEVIVTETGYLYRDNAFGSLSEIARLITGTQWSGPLFFGLKNKKSPNPGPNYVVDLTTKSTGAANGR